MFTLKEILSATKGTLIGAGASHVFSGISTDSRNIKRNKLFIPLKGPNYDGQKFIASALKKGASGSFTSKKLKPIEGKTLIHVKDTLLAFHQIALAHRKVCKAKVVGITGSSGKTTTKDMLASILSIAGKTLKTEENFNNEVGVPKTLLQMERGHKFAVIEMAMQKTGEIEALARIALPDVAVITNIGSAHLEYLGSKKNIAKAKSEILKFQKRGDISVLLADDEFFGKLTKISKGKVVSFGIDSPCDVRAIDIRYQDDKSYFTLHTKAFSIRIDLPLPGRHNIIDAVCAAAAAYALDIDAEIIKKGLEKISLSSKRTNIILTNNIRIIDDTYNANPDSMEASLNMLENYRTRRIAVIGDMLELGAASKESHRRIGKMAADLNIEALVSVGKLSSMAAAAAKKNGMKNVYSAGTNFEALKVLKKLIRPDDTVLVKGSRGMKMEKIVEALAR